MKNQDILSQIAGRSGMTVPEGYFDDFAKRMAASLPVQEWENPHPKVMPRSFWQKVRPYVYMAAMFAGIWCMMKMFDIIRPSNNSFSLENNPILAEAMNNDAFVNDYCIDDIDEYYLLDDLYDQGFTPASFAETASY